MQRIYGLLVLVILLTGITNHSDAQLKNGFKNPFDKSIWYKHYTGNIDGHPIHVNLMLWNNTIDGSFNFVNKSTQAELFTYKKDTVINQEMTIYGFVRNEQFTDSGSKSKIIISKEGIQGKWESADGKGHANISLKEEYPEGTYRFDLVIHRDSFVSEENHSIIYSSYKLPVPGSKMKKDDAAWYEKALADALDHDGINAGNLNEYMHRKDSMEIASYKKLVEDGLAAQDNYYLTLVAEPWYNSNGIVVIKASYYVAIPKGHTRESYYCFDIQHKKVLHLNDIMNVDTSKLEALLENDMKNYYAPIKPNYTGSFAYVSNDMYVSDFGITFLYGNNDFFNTPCFFIPYTKLHDMLKPEFKKRFKL